MAVQKVTLPAGTPHQVQKQFDFLIEHARGIEQSFNALQAKVAGMPAPLTLDQIQQALQAGGSNPLNLENLQGTPAGGSSSGSSSGGDGGGGGMAPAPNHASIVNSVWTSLGINPSSSDHDLFKFVQTVIWDIAQIQPSTDPKVGFVTQGGGDGTYNCMGTIYAVFRLMYDNGANIKILTGSFQPQWTQELNIDVSAWHAPTDPSTVCP